MAIKVSSIHAWGHEDVGLQASLNRPVRLLDTDAVQLGNWCLYLGIMPASFTPASASGKLTIHFCHITFSFWSVPPALKRVKPSFTLCRETSRPAYFHYSSQFWFCFCSFAAVIVFLKSADIPARGKVLVSNLVSFWKILNLWRVNY